MVFGRLTFIGVCVLVVALASCGGGKTLVFYEGEQRPKSVVAIVNVANPNIYVMGIDTLNRKYQSLSADFIELLPGKHYLKVAYRSRKGSSVTPIELEFWAEAGHSYVVRLKSGYTRWTAWIEDRIDGSVTAGDSTWNSRIDPKYP